MPEVNLKSQVLAAGYARLQMRDDENDMDPGPLLSLLEVLAEVAEAFALTQCHCKKMFLTGGTCVKCDALAKLREVIG